MGQLGKEEQINQKVKVIRSLVGRMVTWEGRTDKLEGKCQRSIGHWWVLGSALEGRTNQLEGVKGH